MTATAQSPPATPTNGRPKLKRSMGLWMATALVIGNMTTLVPYAFSAAAQVWLWLVEPEAFNPKHLVRDVAIATLAFAYSVWAIAGAGDDVVTKGFVVLLCGIPVYIGMRWWQTRNATDVPAPVELGSEMAVHGGSNGAR